MNGGKGISMPPELPAPVTAFVQAMNTHDSEALIACFTPDAVVHDEGEEHHGAEAIQGWADAANAKYQTTLQPIALTERGGETVLTAQVSGNFPGSPIPLHFDLTFLGDKISALAIRP